MEHLKDWHTFNPFTPGAVYQANVHRMACYFWMLPQTKIISHLGARGAKILHQSISLSLSASDANST
jgi:hypothetical protein